MSTSFNQEVTGTGASGSDNNNNNNNNFMTGLRHFMFEKVLTPSDVGKLNRLVIPKQHAETHFPLDDDQNGTTLEFHDRYGKSWRFRYSYWHSSQSYVMTKGWSRFIKDKQLEPSDTVSFHRTYVSDENEPGGTRKVMLIDWKHRADIRLGSHHHYPIFGPPVSSLLYPTGGYYPMTGYSMPHYRSFMPLYDNQYQEREFFGYGYGGFVNGGPYYGDVRNPTSEMRRETVPLDYNHLGRSEPFVFNSVPVYPGARMTPLVPPQPQEVAGATKKLRLFGVDMEESSSSSGMTMGLAGYSFSTPVVIKDEDQHSSWRSPRSEIGVSGSSSAMQLSDDEEQKRKGKSLEF